MNDKGPEAVRRVAAETCLLLGRDPHAHQLQRRVPCPQPPLGAPHIQSVTP